MQNSKSQDLVEVNGKEYFLATGSDLLKAKFIDLLVLLLISFIFLIKEMHLSSDSLVRDIFGSVADRDYHYILL